MKQPDQQQATKRKRRRQASPRAIEADALGAPSYGEYAEARGRVRRWLNKRIAHANLYHHRTELLQLCDVALHLATRAYAPSRGPFLPFAWRYVKRETLGMLRAECRERAIREALCREYDLPEPPHYRDLLHLDLPRLIADPLDLELAVHHVLQGRSVRELVARQQRPFRQVRKRLLAAQETLRAYMAHEGSDTPS